MFELSLLFVLGYLLITLEHPLKIDKAATALVMGGLSWVWLSLQGGEGGNLDHHLVEIASVVFFLMAAMTIVEVIESFDGFHLITQALGFTDKRWL